MPPPATDGPPATRWRNISVGPSLSNATLTVATSGALMHNCDPGVVAVVDGRSELAQIAKEDVAIQLDGRQLAVGIHRHAPHLDPRGDPASELASN